MKRIISVLLLTAVMTGFTVPALGNSAPTYWQGYPSSNVMAIQKDSPIQIEKEDLVFDFTAAEKMYSLRGKVTAAYQMLNPTDEALSVQMAFPFVGRLDDIWEKELQITADNQVLPYETYIGDVVNHHGSPRNDESPVSYDFASIVKTITQEPYQAANFSQNEAGKHYLVEVNPVEGQDLNLVLDFSYDAEKTKVFTSGFNGYARDGQNVRLSAWCHQPRTLELYVLGGDIEPAVTGYKDGQKSEQTDSFTCRISVQEKELKAFLMEYVRTQIREHSKIEIMDSQLYNLYAQALDQGFTRNEGCSQEFDLTEQGYAERILTLVYTVDFPPHSERQVRVTYMTAGTMDRSRTVKPLHTFDYILNPAENWSSFRNLNIDIIPPPEAPYVVSSNIELTRGEDKTYSAVLPELPGHDFRFTLYAEEKITGADRARGSINSIFGYFAPLVMVMLGFLLLIILAVVLRRIKRTG